VTDDGRAWGPGVRVKKWTLPPHDELEGWHPLDGKRGLWVTSDRENNVTLGELVGIPSRLSPKGLMTFHLP
jgi:hypothetical protein